MKYSDLKVWSKSMDFVQTIYDMTRTFPTEEKFGLVNQLRRAAVSIPSNIAEGCARKSTKTFIHHLTTALGSLMEAETQIIIATRLTYIDPEKSTLFLEQCKDIAKMLNSLINSLMKQKEPL